MLDWYAPDLAHLVLALAAVEPIHSVDTVRDFAGCVYLCSPGSSDQKPRYDPGNLGELVAGMIEGVALGLAMKAGGKKPGDDPNLRTLPHYVTFRSNPLRVDLLWMSPNGGQERVDVYTPPTDTAPNALQRDILQPWRSSCVMRSCSIPGTLIYAAGELLLNIDQRRRAGPKRNDAALAEAASSRNRFDNDTEAEAEAREHTVSERRRGAQKNKERPVSLSAGPPNRKDHPWTMTAD